MLDQEADTRQASNRAQVEAIDDLIPTTQD